MAALIWSWSSKAALNERLEQALRIVRRLGCAMASQSASYQGLMELLVRWTKDLRICLVSAFRNRMEREFPELYRFAGFVVIGAEGSNLQLSRTLAHQDFYAPAKTRGKNGKKRRKSNRRAKRPKSRNAREQQARRKKAESPQMALTALFHIGLRLSWDWRLLRPASGNCCAG